MTMMATEEGLFSVSTRYAVLARIVMGSLSVRKILVGALG